MKLILLTILYTFQLSAIAQSFEDQVIDNMNDDISLGGDIFNNFNEDAESKQVAEDEKFYRYGRFYSFNIGLGFTTFTGNRGDAYKDDHPTFNLSFTYFFDFKNAFVMGVQYSRHTMILDTPTRKFEDVDNGVGTVETSFLRPFFGYRYYADTSNLSSAISYANPYFTLLFEYWYQTNKFPEINKEPQKGGGIGVGMGMGFEFPIEVKHSYWGVEFLLHQVAYFDRNTSDYEKVPNNPESTHGYKDLNGPAISVMISYDISW